ncbi:MAG: hypothetical protein HY282_13075 [Nitrospirae bacterium]|nr:hypothetical protein [Candidatus Manganitrophaceae bacterium]
MNNGKNLKNWLQTLPGILTSLTAVVTALAGLIVAIKQTGWFEPKSPPVVTTAPPPAPSSPSGTTYAVTLPAMRDYKLGNQPGSARATFTLLKAEVAPRTAEKETLQIRLRMMNHRPFDANFWDRSFRLVLDGVPLAPDGGLNALIPAQSAKEGEVLFVIPRNTTAAKLQISYADDSTEIPLDLTPP